jgi:GT2 family glycosyltransferase
MTALATVVVVTWQGKQLLRSCLDALNAQSLSRGDFAVVVVDNASSDGTAELLEERSDVQRVTAPRNLGFAGGATLGLTTVTTPYAVILNNDTQPEPDWLEHLLAGFAPGVAAVTSKVLLEPRFVLLSLDADPREVHRVLVNGLEVNAVVTRRPGGAELAVPAAEGTKADVRVVGKKSELLRTSVNATAPRFDVLNSTGGIRTATGHGADRGYLEVDIGQYDNALDVFAVCGAAAAFRTDLGAAAGWFDPWLFAYYEDLDLSWQLRRAGWMIRYVPSARVRHKHAATSRVGSEFFMFHNRRNRLAVLARNATPREMLDALTASRRPRPAMPASIPGRDVSTAPLPAARGKGAALLSFLARMPWLVADRMRHPVPSPTAADVPGS